MIAARVHTSQHVDSRLLRGMASEIVSLSSTANAYVWVRRERVTAASSDAVGSDAPGRLRYTRLPVLLKNTIWKVGGRVSGQNLPGTLQRRGAASPWSGARRYLFATAVQLFQKRWQRPANEIRDETGNNAIPEPIRVCFGAGIKHHYTRQLMLINIRCGTPPPCSSARDQVRGNFFQRIVLVEMQSHETKMRDLQMINRFDRLFNLFHVVTVAKAIQNGI